MDSIDDILGDIPLPPYVTAEDITFAVKAITVHAAEQQVHALIAEQNAPRP